MSNLKKIRKKLLTSVLGTTLLTGGLVGIQSVSAMSSNKTKLENIYLLNVMQKIRDKKTLIKYAQINKKCLDTLKMTHINPIPVTTKELFPKMQTLYLYGPNGKYATNISGIEEEMTEFNYSMGIDEIIRNALFINGYDKEYSDELISKVKDVQEIFELELKLEKLNKHSSNSNSDQEKIQKIAERIQRIKEKYQNYQELEKKLSIELEGLLSNLPTIHKREYEYLKNFINCMAPDFEESKEFKEFKNQHIRYEKRETATEDIIKKTVMEDIKYTYQIIETKSKSKKALVYIVVNKDSQLTREHLIHIIEELKEQGVEININNSVFGTTDCKNVIFTIRPEGEQKFEISEHSFFKFCNLTVNIVRARAGRYAFRSCSDSVINIYDSYFIMNDDDSAGVIDNCHNFILNVHNTELGRMSIINPRGNTTLNIYDDSQLLEDAIAALSYESTDNVTLNIYGDARLDEGAIAQILDVTLNIYGDARLDEGAIEQNRDVTLNIYSDIEINEDDIKERNYRNVVVKRYC